MKYREILILAQWTGFRVAIAPAPAEEPFDRHYATIGVARDQAMRMAIERRLAVVDHTCRP